MSSLETSNARLRRCVHVSAADIDYLINYFQSWMRKPHGSVLVSEINFAASCIGALRRNNNGAVVASERQLDKFNELISIRDRANAES